MSFKLIEKGADCCGVYSDIDCCNGSVNFNCTPTINSTIVSILNNCASNDVVLILQKRLKNTVGWIQIHTFIPNLNTYIDIDVIAGESYEYRLIVTGRGCEDSIAGPIVVDIPIAFCCVTAPNMNVIQNLNNEVLISVLDVAGDCAQDVNISIERSSDQINWVGLNIGALPFNFTDTPGAGTWYYRYKVIGNDCSIITSTSQTITITNPPCCIDAPIITAVINGIGIDISVSGGSCNNGVTYVIRRVKVSNNSSVLLTSSLVLPLNFTDLTYEFGTEYNYVLDVQSSNCSSTNIATTNIISPIQCCEAQPDFSFDRLSDTQVELILNSYTCDLTLTGFTIRRRLVGDIAFTNITTINSVPFTFTDTVPAGPGSYEYVLEGIGCNVTYSYIYTKLEPCCQSGFNPITFSNVNNTSYNVEISGLSCIGTNTNNYILEYSDNNITWTTAFVGILTGDMPFSYPHTQPTQNIRYWRVRTTKTTCINSEETASITPVSNPPCCNVPPTWTLTQTDLDVLVTISAWGCYTDSRTQGVILLRDTVPSTGPVTLGILSPAIYPISFLDTTPIAGTYEYFIEINGVACNTSTYSLGTETTTDPVAGPCCTINPVLVSTIISQTNTLQTMTSAGTCDVGVSYILQYKPTGDPDTSYVNFVTPFSLPAPSSLNVNISTSGSYDFRIAVTGACVPVFSNVETLVLTAGDCCSNVIGITANQLPVYVDNAGNTIEQGIQVNIFGGACVGSTTYTLQKSINFGPFNDIYTSNVNPFSYVDSSAIAGATDYTYRVVVSGNTCNTTTSNINTVNYEDPCCARSIGLGMIIRDCNDNVTPCSFSKRNPPYTNDVGTFNPVSRILEFELRDVPCCVGQLGSYTWDVLYSTDQITWNSLTNNYPMEAIVLNHNASTGCNIATTGPMPLDEITNFRFSMYYDFENDKANFPDGLYYFKTIVYPTFVPNCAVYQSPVAPVNLSSNTECCPGEVVNLNLTLTLMTPTQLFYDFTISSSCACPGGRLDYWYVRDSAFSGHSDNMLYWYFFINGPISNPYSNSLAIPSNQNVTHVIFRYKCCSGKYVYIKSLI